MEDMFNEDDDDDHEFEENMVAAMPISTTYNTIYNTATACTTALSQ